MSEYTEMKKTLKSYQISGLEIDIDLICDDLGDVNIPIVFNNNSNKALELIFDNNSGSVESYCLQIFDDVGNRVIWRHKIHIRPDDVGLEFHVIPQNESWKYNLSAKLNQNELRFNGCVYYLEIGRTYHIQYIYPWDKINHHTSNVIRWKIPNI